MNLTTLISADELQTLMAVRKVRIIDCRFDLADTLKGEKMYRKGHIPGASYAHLDNDLSSPITPVTGRHPLPDPARFAQWLGSQGVDNQTQVIAYDDSFGTMAVRLWWLLRWLGHDRVAVLDGGWQAWERAGGVVSTDIPNPANAVFTATLREELELTTSQILAQDEDILLLDARTAVRHRGEDEPIDPVAGHIPGSLNLPLQQNLDRDGRFLPPEQLREMYLDCLGGHPSSRVACYCGSGVTACHNLLAMEVAGLHGGLLYAGSWSEWIRDPSHPVAVE
jgi:thiosulfate/3-mercaptopyruvate sulfurtransferase